MISPVFTAINDFYAGLQTSLLIALIKHFIKPYILFLFIWLFFWYLLFTFPQIYWYTQLEY